MHMTAKITPLTIDQLHAAMHPDDWDDHVVTARDAELLGLSFRHDDASAKLFAWLRDKGWTPGKQAAGCVLWQRGSDYLWLSGTVEYAAAEIVCALRGDKEPQLPHGRVRPCETRPGLEILAEIVSTQPTADDHAAIERWDGGGTFVLVSKS